MLFVISVGPVLDTTYQRQILVMCSSMYVPAAITFVRPAANVCVCVCENGRSAKVLTVTGRKRKFKHVLKWPGNGEVSQEPAIMRPIS